MEEPPFTVDLSGCRAAIWGLGLMGGSLAMALRGKCAEIVGIDPDAAAVAYALEHGVIQRGSANPADLMNGVDLIVLAAPVRAILANLRDLPDRCAGGAVVLDLGSTKAEIAGSMSWLPERFEAVGGHPMCGKETSSIRSADPLLYQGAPFALCETARTTPRARQAAEAVARACGAHPLWLDPAQHDRWVAYTSHAPYLLACALAEAVPQEASPMIGPGFRGMTRLAASSPRMMADIHATNAAQIRAALRTIIERLEAYDALIQAGSPQVLEETFRRAQAESQARSAPTRTA